MPNDTDSLEFIKETIIKVITNENGRPIPPGIVVGKLLKQASISDPHLKSNVYLAIEQLIHAGTLKQLTKTKYLVLGYVNAPIDHSKVLEGTINTNSNNSGFITADGEDKAHYFVFRTNLNGALNGDRVQFALMNKPPKVDLLDAVVTKVISHSKDFYVGIFILKPDKTYDIKIDDDKFYLKVVLDSIDGLVNGQKILIKIKAYEKDTAYGTVSRILGHKDDAGVDILSIVYDNGVEPDFPDTVIDYAKKITLDISDEQRKIRKDLTRLPIVTIDPKSSKDFDDAIYVDTLDDNKFFLSVSIADVSHYVRFQSVLDEEALKRGCSIYLTDRVIPMLPHNLSDDICSLNPNVERLTLTCDMVIHQDGSMSEIKVYPSIIKSHRRFSYDEVNEYFTKKSLLTNDTAEVRTMLDKALMLHHILDTNKKKRGYINFEIPEPLIILNDQGIPIEIKKRESGTAQKIIEDFMVAANEAVTIYANQKKWPFVYRVHDKPSEDRLKNFALEAKKLGFKINSKIEDIQPSSVAKWIENNQGNKNLDLINMMLLRTMAKAEYDIKNIGHFGLALTNYTHFTSPIRRYPDLMVHRIFWMFEFSKNLESDANRNQMVQLLKKYTELSSKNELTAVKCEREVNAMKFAEYMSNHLGEQFEATVTTVTAFGIFIQLNNTIEGLIKLNNMKSDFYQYNEKTNELIGQRQGLRFSLGTKVLAKVIMASKELRKIEFELIKHLGNR